MELRKKEHFVFGAISNSPSVGGFKLPFYEDSTLDDGKFEVLLVAALDNLEVLHNAINWRSDRQILILNMYMHSKQIRLNLSVKKILHGHWMERMVVNIAQSLLKFIQNQ